MLTPIDFKNNYFALLAESQSITGMTPRKSIFYVYENVTEDNRFTDEEWSNLVKVASIIKANQNRFAMQNWHKESECGVVHCIAGWAESLVKNDTNYTAPYSTWYTATKVLSKYTEPFFFIGISALIYSIDERKEYEGLPEQLVMKWFIDPILEEARKESHELSSEITQFIQRTQQEQMSTCGV